MFECVGDALRRAVGTDAHLLARHDLPLLDKVHEPVATNPDARLSAIAAERGWRVLNLFE